MTTVVVEGASDRIAVLTLAGRHGRDLAAEGHEVVELGGATNIGRYVAEHLATRRGLDLAGLYDVGEEGFFVRAFQRAGVGGVEGRADLERLGFFAFEPDLEDELIRAVGERRMLEVIDAHGELASFRLLQHQPVQRSWSQHDQLRRFLSGRSGHKLTYARALVGAMELDSTPRPLTELLSRL